jgi:hypothetical protein
MQFAAAAVVAEQEAARLQAQVASASELAFNISSFIQFQKHEKLKDKRIGRRYW